MKSVITTMTDDIGNYRFLGFKCYRVDGRYPEVFVNLAIPRWPWGCWRFIKHK